MKKVRADRRDSQDEKRQKATIAENLKSLCDAKELKLDLSEFDSVSRGKKSMYMSSNGAITMSSEKKRNKFYDSKTFDALATVTGPKNSMNLYFVCKYTKDQGGFQDDVPFEMGTTVKCISKHENKHDRFVLLLDGGYWGTVNPKELRLPKNCVVANAENLYETIETTIDNVIE